MITRALSVPIQNNHICVPNCNMRLNEAAKAITNSNIDILFSIENERGDIFDRTVCFGCDNANIIKMPEFGIFTKVLWIEPSDFSFDEKHYSLSSVFFDVPKGRSHLGYFLVACIAVVLSEASLNIIEDSSNFWVNKEFINTQEFLERVRIPRLHGEEIDISRLIEAFYSNLNWATV